LDLKSLVEYNAVPETKRSLLGFVFSMEASVLSLIYFLPERSTEYPCIIVRPISSLHRIPSSPEQPSSCRPHLLSRALRGSRVPRLWCNTNRIRTRLMMGRPAKTVQRHPDGKNSSADRRITPHEIASTAVSSKAPVPSMQRLTT
jgi:hypothetical protein